MTCGIDGEFCQADALDAELTRAIKERDAYKKAYSLLRNCNHLGPCRCRVRAETSVKEHQS